MEDMVYSTHIGNAMAADDLAAHRVMASAAIASSNFSWNIPNPVP